jgi:hypothetical protein
LNPAHWPLWWQLLCAGMGGFVVGVATTARMAARAAAERAGELAREMVRKGGNGGTLPPA